MSTSDLHVCSTSCGSTNVSGSTAASASGGTTQTTTATSSTSSSRSRSSSSGSRSRSMSESLRLFLPRADQEPLNYDEDYSEIISALTPIDPKLSSLLSTDPNEALREIESRLFGTEEPTYYLPLGAVAHSNGLCCPYSVISEAQRIARLDKQHAILRLGLWGLYPSPTLIHDLLGDPGSEIAIAGQNKRILDIGCGAGQWAYAMAHEFPGAQVVALDQPREIENKMPTNITFEPRDVNEKLTPHYNAYDVVHSRFVAHSVRSYRQLLDEAAKCLKPGGIAIFIEGDLDVFEEDQKTIVEPASENNPNGSYLQRWTQAVRRSQIARCNLRDVDDSPETLDKGLWHLGVYDPKICFNGSVFTPTSPWPSSTLPEEDLHFKIAGVLMRQNFKIFLTGTKYLVMDDGISEAEADEWILKIRAELESEKKTWFRWRVCWGRKPLGPEAEPSLASPSTSVAPHQSTMLSAFPTPRATRPVMIPSGKREKVRRQLRNTIRHFQIQQFHTYGERRSLENLEERERSPFSTRGKFF